MAAMADLTDGVQIRHRSWRSTGTVQVDETDTDCDFGPLVHVKWDGHFVDDEISESGPVRPEDVEILS